VPNVIPGTPLRTAAYLAFYTVIAVLGIGLFAQLNSGRWTLAVAAGIAAVALVVGIPIRVSVERASWRRMCKARNVALCAALLFSAVDVVGLVWFVVSFSGWQQ
jgi:hypothetical protein